jgi:hypothetical protein
MIFDLVWVISYLSNSLFPDVIADVAAFYWDFGRDWDGDRSSFVEKARFAGAEDKFEL